MSEHKKAKSGHPQVSPAEVAAAAAASEVSAPDRLQELETALAAKSEEAQANWDKFLRERADLENYRKRVQKEKEDLSRYGQESLLVELLPVVDNLERALEHADDSDPVVVGVRMTLEMLLAVLRKANVAVVAVDPGTPFDPALHQAMCQVEAEQPANSVVGVLQKGYTLHDRLIRPAMVTVAK